MVRILALLIGCAAFGQTPPALPQFEAASVKLAPESTNLSTMPRGLAARLMDHRFEGGPGTDEPGQMMCTACELSGLITTAYEVSSSQLSLRGVPYFERYDIVAKVPRGSTRHDVNLMLRQLLAERFQLKLHREKGLTTVYALVLGKQEPGLQRTGEETPGAIPYPTLSGNHLFTLTGRQKSLGQLADAMSMFTDAPVVDMTGLKGGYDFALYWVASLQSRPKKSEWPPGMKKLALRVEDAVRQQLGLKLAARRAPMDRLVVDSVSSTPVLD